MPVPSLEPIAAAPGLSFLPVGAQVVSDGVSFRVWAPDHRELRVVTGAAGFETRYVPLERDADGFFSGRDEAGRAGDLYWVLVDAALRPDPASRFQPNGVDGPSQVIDPHRYAWRTKGWRRPPLRGRVIYELHIGAFTPEGTFDAVRVKLKALVDLGVNTIELMPLGDFCGDWNWGYDGVLPFAPSRRYGRPDALRALVDDAHAHGLAVVLDVVYNHLGPCGNVLPLFSNAYFHREHATGWGQALNFDGAGATAVRQYFLQNACAWLDEYRIDGLRLDAVHAMTDRSSPHIVAEIAAAAQTRGAFVIAEDERNDARIITPDAEGGWGVDGMWSDDFHHTLRVAMTGQREAHFGGFRGTIDEWVEALRDGWIFQGQVFPPSGRPRGTPCAALAPERFVVCISNHDQVGNRPLGDRLHDVISPQRYRAVSMLFCFLPYTPLLFMGQEWAASTPFPYFTHQPGEIGARMGEHRRSEFAQRHASYDPAMLARMPPPQAESTFRAAKLKWEERQRPPHAGILALYRECLHLRAREAIFQSPPRSSWSVDKIGADAIALCLRDARAEWLLAAAVTEGGAPIPLPVSGAGWRRVLSSNEARFGGAENGSVGAELISPEAVLWQRSL